MRESRKCSSNVPRSVRAAKPRLSRYLIGKQLIPGPAPPTLTPATRVSALRFRLPRRRMPSFVGGDVSLVLQSETDIVEPIQQAVAHEVVDLEAARETLIVVDLALLQVDGQLIAFAVGAAHEFGHFVFGQRDIEESVLCAVVGEDVGERWGDDGAESIVGKCPHGVLAGGTAAKIFSGDQDACALMAGVVRSEERR